MDNDRVFAAYTLTLVAAVASMITASVLAGFATLPSAGVFIEHLAMSLGFRLAYKSIGGFEWVTAAAEAVGFITDQGEVPSHHSGMSAAGA